MARESFKSHVQVGFFTSQFYHPHSPPAAHIPSTWTHNLMSVHHSGVHSTLPVTEPVRSHSRAGCVDRPRLTEPKSNTSTFTLPVTLPCAPISSQPVRVYGAGNSNSMRVVHKSNSMQTIRNYPSPHARSLTTHSSSLPLRPLPAVPRSAPPMGGSDFPQSPMPPALPLSTRPLPPPPYSISPPSNHISPPSNHPRSRRLNSFRNLTINTNTPKVEEPRSSDSPISIASSIEPPSPMTVKRKQHSKLRRYLGESIPAELIYGQKENAGVTFSTHLDDVPEEIKISQDYTFWKVAPIPDEDSGYDSDSTVSEGDQHGRHLGKTLEMRWVPSRTTPGLESDSKRHRTIGKWLKEKDNRRWVAKDYQDVLHALRKLWCCFFTWIHSQSATV